MTILQNTRNLRIEFNIQQHKILGKKSFDQSLQIVQYNSYQRSVTRIN